MFTSLEEIIDQSVQIVESGKSFRMPIENRKNAYTKACWLLYIYQRFNLRTGEKIPELKERIDILKSKLPWLREYVAMKEKT